MSEAGNGRKMGLAGCAVLRSGVEWKSVRLGQGAHRDWVAIVVIRGDAVRWTS